MHLSPITDLGVICARSANKMNTCGERGGFACAEAIRGFRRNRPRSSNDPPAPDHATEQSLPSFRCLVRKDDRTDPAITEDPATLGERESHPFLKERAILRSTVELLDLI